MVRWNERDIIDGKYQILGLLGEGGVGPVYRARHLGWTVDLAVRSVRPQLIATDATREAFVQKVGKWVDLGLHPHLAQCFYVRELDGLVCIFVEYVSGGTLQQWLSSGNLEPDDWESILSLMIQISDGLAWAHARGVTHGDVKPANCLVREDGRICVTDFGLAKLTGSADLKKLDVEPLLSPGTSLYVRGCSLGTPRYAAPEQWGEANASQPTADVYALGVMCFELCCGCHPFQDDIDVSDPEALIEHHMAASVPNPRRSNRHVPRRLAKVIRQCLAKNPRKRPQTAAELREMLAAVYAKLTGRRARNLPESRTNPVDALNDRAASLWDLGRPDEARALWGQALELDPQDLPSCYNRGILQWRTGEVTGEEVLRRLRELAASGHRTAALATGYVQMERVAFGEAEAALAEALEDEQTGEDYAVWRLLGDACMAQQKYQKAEAAYSRACQLEPNDEAMQQSLAMARSHTRESAGQLIFPSCQCVATFKQHRRPVTCVAITSDGRRALSGSEDGSICVWELFDQRLLTICQGRGMPRAIATIPDSGQAVIGYEDGHIAITEMPNMHSVRVLEGHTKKVNCIGISPDGSHAASGSFDRSVRLWDLTTGKCLQTLEGHKAGVFSVAITPDGQRCLSGGGGEIRLWDMQTGECLRLFAAVTSVKSLAITSDGQLVVSGHNDMLGRADSFRVWELSTGEPLQRFGELEHGVKDHSITAGSRWLLSVEQRHGSNREAYDALRLRELPSGRLLRTLHMERPEPITCAAVSQDGRWALTGGGFYKDFALRLWEVGAEVIARWCAPVMLSRANRAQHGVLEERSSADSSPERVAATAGSPAPSGAGQLRHARMVRTFEGHKYPVSSVAIIGKGELAVSGANADPNYGKGLRVWELATGTCIQSLREEWNVYAIAITEDGHGLLSAGWSSDIHLWALPAGECTKRLSGPQARVHSLAMLPDGRRFMSASGMRVCLWDLAGGRMLNELWDRNDAVLALAVSPDGQWAISGGRRGRDQHCALRVWDLARGECVRRLEGHEDDVRCVAVSPDGKWILSTARSGHFFEGRPSDVRLWDTHDWRCIATLDGHAHTVTSICFAPDGRWAVSGSVDHTLRVWELPSGRCIRTLEGHDGQVTSIAISPDGSSVLSGSVDKTLRLWQLEWEG